MKRDDQVKWDVTRKQGVQHQNKGWQKNSTQPGSTFISTIKLSLFNQDNKYMKIEI